MMDGAQHYYDSLSLQAHAALEHGLPMSDDYFHGSNQANVLPSYPTTSSTCYGYGEAYNYAPTSSNLMQTQDSNSYSCPYSSPFSSSYSDSYQSYQSVTSSAPPPAQSSLCNLQIPAQLLGTRVHINPNFRPKLEVGHDISESSAKPSNVHVNPHWRPKLEEKSDSKARASGNPVSTKKMIYVNPKILSQVTSQSRTDPEFHLSSFQKPTSTSNVEEKRVCSSTCTSGDSDQPKIIAETRISSSSRYQNLSESTLVAVSTTKLIRKQGQFVKRGPVNLTSNATVTHSRIKKHFISPSNSVSHKVAKQVASKYKFVRNIVSVNSPAAKTVNPVISKFRYERITPSDSPKTIKNRFVCIRRKARRKSIPGAGPEKSIYKYVRKAIAPEQQRKQEAVSSSCGSTLSPFKLKRSNSGNKIVKTRFKLIKVADAHKTASESVLNSEKLRKLVHAGLSSRSVKLRSLKTMHYVKGNAYPNKYLYLREAESSGRKVSRYQIVRTSPVSKLKVTFMSPTMRLFKATRGRMAHYGNRVWQKGGTFEPTRVRVNSAKFERIGFSPMKRGTILEDTRRTASSNKLLNIGGVLYRSTPTTLTRTQGRNNDSSGRVVHIRGRKFLLDTKGITLCPISSNNSQKEVLDIQRAPLARVDIGGVTFIRRDGNTLVRTNTHHARNRVSLAKMKSIALLTDKLRKNNQPCLIYHRFGKCGAHEKGKCWRVHDPKNIAICPKFLQGCCEVDSCSLSHNVGPEKMPTCHHFLDGCCVRDNCPYLHVKLSAHAAICRQFLNGYCALGDTCKKRHVFLCPDFEKDGKCVKGKYCPYPHKTRLEVRKYKRVAPRTVTNRGKSKSRGDAVGKFSNPCPKEERKRYYHKEKDLVEGQADKLTDSVSGDLKGKRTRIMKQIDHLKKIRCAAMEGYIVENEDTSMESEISDCEASVDPERPKLGVLPSYIPLE